jgi:hypothetical protein
MIPSFTPEPLTRDFIDPWGRTYNPVVSWAQGGAAINDGTQGRQIQLWYADLTPSAIRINTEYGGLQTSLAIPGVSKVSLAFDGNMQPVVAYKDGPGERMRFYDITLPGFNTMYEPLADSSLVAPDDNRDDNQSGSDVIWAYTKSGNLYIRVQRERFQTERLVGVAHGKLINMGPTEGLRFQLKLHPS